jgi:hypothetical protein
MGLTPRSDALNVDGAFEVIAVVGVVVPSPLAVSFARLAARGCGTVALAPDAAWVGNKEGLTMLTPTTTSLFEIRVTTRYVAPAYPREQQEAAYVPSLSDRW